LASLSPLAVLSRGYALVYDESGKLLKNAADGAVGELLSTQLARGTLESRVTKITL
jgi:exodeoxyribonuclease VII large subunit